MISDNDQKLRNRLVQHLKGGQAFSSIDTVVKKMPFDKVGIVPEGLPYSFFQQFYHIRISQYDIVDYCRNEDYQAPNWPDQYWPENPAPSNEAEWDTLTQNYFDEREEFCKYILNQSNDLFEPFPANPDHNLLREAELIIEHTAYHTGQLYVIYRLLSA